MRLTRRVFTEVESLCVSLDDTRNARALEPDLARVFASRPPELGQLAAEVVRLRDAARASRDRGGGLGRDARTARASVRGPRRARGRRWGWDGA